MKTKGYSSKIVATLLILSFILPSPILALSPKDDSASQWDLSTDMVSDILEPLVEPEVEIIEMPVTHSEEISYALGEEVYVSEAIDNSEHYLREFFDIPEDVVIDRSKHIEEYLEVDLPADAVSDSVRIDTLTDVLAEHDEAVVRAAAVNTSRITIRSQTMTSVTFSYSFASTDRNRYMFFYDACTNDWDWDINTWNNRGIPTNPPVSGTVTVNNLMPGGTYKIRMSYNNTGSWVYDYYEFTQPADTSGTVVVEGIHMKMTIPNYLRNMLGASEATRYIQALDISYNHLANLVGAVPYNGEKINISATRQGSFIAQSGNPIKFKEAYLIEDFLYFRRPIGLSVYSNHELSHNFDSARWNFDAEFFACFKSAYVYDMTKYSFVDHETFYANGDMTSFFKSDQVYGGYDGMISSNTYHHYGLCYRMMKIKEQIGWEPFRQTFRYFNTIAAQSLPTNNLGKLNLFLTKLKDFSGKDVIAMMTAAEKNIYKAKFGGNIAYYTGTILVDDHSNSIWEGTLLTKGVATSGVINFAGDVDCFKFIAPTSGKYIVMSGGSAPLSLQTAYVLDTSTSASSISALFTDSTKNFKKVFEFTAGKTYLFKIAHTSATATTGSYTVTVKNDDGSIDDHSNSIWLGSMMTEDTAVIGKINYAGDLDCFKFIAPRTGNYTVVSGGGTPLTLKSVYEVQPNGSASGKYAISTDSTKSFSKVYSFTAGKTYLLQVGHVSSVATTGNYTIKINERHAIVVVPGLLGTRLKIGTRQIWEPNVGSISEIAGNVYNLGENLECDNSGNSVKTVTTIEDNAGATDIYKPLYDALYEEFHDQYDVIFFDYDWRLDCNYNAQLLKTELQSYNQVHLVAHSMGGLVSSAFMAESTGSYNKVKTLTTIATPFTGSVKAPAIFETGEMMGNWTDILLKNAFKRIAPNMNTAYQLLPTSRYQRSDFAKKIVLSNGNETTVEPTSYSGSINLVKERDWAVYKGQFFNTAESFHSGLMTNNKHITDNREKVLYIIGSGHNTVDRVTYMYEEYPANIFCYTVLDYSSNGDGTVMAHSGNNANSTNNTVISIAGADHTGIASNESAIAYAIQFIETGSVNVSTPARAPTVTLEEEKLSVLVYCNDELNVTDINGYEYVREENKLFRNINGLMEEAGTIWAVGENMEQYALDVSMDYVFNFSNETAPLSSFLRVIDFDSENIFNASYDLSGQDGISIHVAIDNSSIME